MLGPVAALLFCSLWLIPSVAFTQVAVPSSYHAVTSRTILPKPVVPALGAAGYRFSDPTFGSRLLRVTDANTRPGKVGRSYSTSSAAHQLAWNATSDRFYIRSLDGWFIPYNFDATTMTASRIQPTPTGDGGLLVSSQVEPQFSFVSRDIIYGSTRDQSDPLHDYPVVHKFDFSSGTYTELLNLREVTALDPDTYAGALSSSAAAPEKVSIMFGGCCQDSHFKVAVFETSSPERAKESAIVLNTRDSLLQRKVGGVVTELPTSAPLGFRLHHAWIDQSGRWMVLYPANAVPSHFVVWDLTTHAFTPVTTRPWGHDALGYGVQVNQDCCASGAQYDGAQWQLRSLSSPQSSVDVVTPQLSPQQIYLADHTSWNNAQPDRRVPFLSSLYRYYKNTYNTTPWRAWDDEIVAVGTEAGPAPTTVWRFAHHRSNITMDPYENDPEDGTYFWYQPHAVIAPNGRWALFTSNWEKTLGLAVGGEDGGIYRTDVFIVALSAGTFMDDPLIAGVTAVKAFHLTELRTRIDVLRVTHGLPIYPWADAGLEPGFLIKAAHLVDLRTALAQAYAAAGASFPILTDQLITAGATGIRAAHIQELRDAVVALEGG